MHAPQVDILAYDDDDNYVRAVYGSPYGERQLEFFRETNGVDPWPTSLTPHDFGSDPFYLRLTKVGNVYTQYYSLDGATYEQANSPLVFGDGTPAKVGFAAFADPHESTHAYIDSIQISGTAPVPEPSTLIIGLVNLGLVGTGIACRRRRARAPA